MEEFGRVWKSLEEFGIGWKSLEEFGGTQTIVVLASTQDGAVGEVEPEIISQIAHAAFPATAS